MHSEIVLPPYRILASHEGLPELYDHYRKHAVLVDEIDHDSSERTACFFAVGRGDSLSLIVFVEPPRSYQVSHGTLELDVISTFPVATGPR